jgi:hypothetical protein
MNTGSEIAPILAGYEGISLEEVNKASLMRRKDNKYLFSVQHLPSLLSWVKNEYRVLDIDGHRAQHYHTCYFDTEGQEMYHKHHRGMANRHKVRIRRYGASDLHFLEVKLKNAKGVTTKKRVRTDGMDHSLLLKEEEFLLSCSPYVGEEITPSMENEFFRVTLVNHRQTERVTLDYDLRFSSRQNGEELILPGIAIAEIKYEGFLSGSSMHGAMRLSHISPSRFSKYAIGMALLHTGLKQNRFKHKVRKVHQINNDYQPTTKLS